MKTGMEEKRKDLKSVKQKEIIDRLVGVLNNADPGFYYMAASDVAHEIRRLVKAKKHLNQDEFLLLEPLTRRDIQLILSFH